MIGYRFMCKMYQNHRGKTWRKWGEQCPYCIVDKRTKGRLDFVVDYHFNRYHKLGEKAYRLYWYLHPNAR